MNKDAPLVPPELGKGKPDGGNSFLIESIRSSLVHVEHRDRRSGTRYHVQPGVEIHLTMEGRGIFQVAGRNHPQGPREGLVFRGGNPHQLTAVGGLSFQRTVICFRPEDFGASIKGAALPLLDWLPDEQAFPFALNEGDFVRFDELARRLRYESQLRPQGWREAVFGLLLGLLSLVRRNGMTALPGASDAVRSRRGDLVQQACAHVRQHLADPLPLGQVAAWFGVTPEHLTRSFRRHLGLSFHRYVLAERVAKARELLRNQPGTTITDIAFAVGFESAGHFGKVFKRHTRLTPGEFRATEP